MAVNIAIIGLGTVGGGVYELVRRRIANISDRVGADLVIKRVCDIKKEASENHGVPSDIFTSDYNEILRDDSIHLVAVLTGSVEAGFKIIKGCFDNGKHVVTANKALLALKWKEIFRMARNSGCLIYFEASVGSGIPVIQGINEGLSANTITKIRGILNGTTNFILTRMSREGCTMEEALEVAVKEGFAEPDSSADIDGLDAAHKICVLANVILDRPVEFERIYCEGINGIEPDDIRYAGEMFDLNVKMLSVMENRDGSVELRVHPALIPENDMLYNVNYENNGIVVEGDSAGQVMFYGKGAGRYPAASAVVSDIIYLAQKINYGIAGKIPYIHTSVDETTPVIEMDDLYFQYYVRFTTADKPGVLSRISGILGENEVSIASCFQKGHSASNDVPILMLTHKSNEGKLKNALKEIDRLDIVRRKSVFIRIEAAFSSNELY